LTWVEGVDNLVVEAVLSAGRHLRSLIAAIDIAPPGEENPVAGRAHHPLSAVARWRREESSAFGVGERRVVQVGSDELQRVEGGNVLRVLGQAAHRGSR